MPVKMDNDMKQAAQDQQAGPEYRREWPWRRLSAGATLVVTAAVSWTSTLTPYLRVCDTAGLCRPLELTDAPIILTVLLAGGLMFPDISRFKVGVEGVEVEKDRDKIGPDEDLEPRREQLILKGSEFQRIIQEWRNRP